METHLTRLFLRQDQTGDWTMVNDRSEIIHRPQDGNAVYGVAMQGLVVVQKPNGA
jgi:hypothetical protein